MSRSGDRWALARQVVGVIRLGPFDTSTDAGRSRERYRRVGLTFLATVAGRGAAAVVSLVSVPLMLRYLGAERYGMWAALSSTWAALLFADLGIGNGLLSVLAEDAGREDRAAARRNVSSAFLSLLAVAGVLALAFAAVYPLVPWAGLFRLTSATAVREAGPCIAVFVGCVLSTLPLGVASRVRMARQEGFSNSAWSAAGSLLGLALLLAGMRAGAGLPALALALTGAPALALLAQTAALFGVQERSLRPSFSDGDARAALRILRLGFAFSVLQLASAVAVSSDALLAGVVLGPAAAARFAVVLALFDLPLSLLTMLLTPFWPAYGEAWARRDVRWMRTALARSVLLSLAFAAVVGAGLVLLGPFVVRVWVGAEMVPSRALLVLMALRLAALSVSQALAMFLNGARLIRLQLAFGPAMAVAAVALKVFLGGRFGLPGLVAGGVAALVLLALVPYAIALRRWLRRVTESAASPA